MIRTHCFRLAPLVGLFTLVLAADSTAPAVELSFQAKGLIFNAGGPPVDDIDILIGQDLFIEYQFNADPQDLDPSQTRGEYFDPNGLVRVTAGPNVYEAIGLGLVVEETATGDVFSIAQFVDGNLLAGSSDAAIGLTMIDPSGRALDGDKLPSSPPLPQDFDQIGFALGFGGPADDDDGNTVIFGRNNGGVLFQDDSDVEFTFAVRDDNDVIDPFGTHALRASQISVVPEPASVVAAAIAVACVAGMVLRRRLM